MKELNVSEIELVSGAGAFYDLGYAVGSAVEAVGNAIGGAIQQAVGESVNYAFQQQYG